MINVYSMIHAKKKKKITFGQAFIIEMSSFLKYIFLHHFVYLLLQACRIFLLLFNPFL